MSTFYLLLFTPQRDKLPIFYLTLPKIAKAAKENIETGFTVFTRSK